MSNPSIRRHTQQTASEKQQTGANARLILILGGARSGKSAFAERLAESSEGTVAFIATATAGDEEMQQRIQRHQAERPPHWLTIEEPLDLSTAVRQAAASADIILLDCVTVWLSNWLFAQPDLPQDEEAFIDSAEYSERGGREIEALLQTLSTLEDGKTLIAISNEVGLGIVPAYALGRLYRDILGRINQRLATEATQVYFMIAGLGVDIKRLHEEASLFFI
ncbi:bifunctional adenosylcobinamide kinase/adenosylcobinamide-phosphate guanylyltransferase [Tengunoibacter tsumagoiensis]|uniref:Adenosylcobinamide kinase n=1 Tax=Tengunoibacter tsumagoiensis TaxID=2014871 RepID=A0A401ZYR4_9CHLR|nr:bifunctional adenosylcobinamide kinase/adenosylcobinamide-phosphate guanylyltransferase [Tengunoibacter tsumagoiensis]GCE11980.1 adenosylcobinamide kinase/adenosylcobinamide phosphate guanyltransferase [Tengunoibacter tsumagoiensis]